MASIDSNTAAPALGGTLKNFAYDLQKQGKTAHLTDCDNQIWIPWSRFELTRMPMTNTSTPNPKELKALLKKPGIHILTYLIEPTESYPANCFLYLCRNQEYDLYCLSKNGRKAIKRGFRNVSIRRIPWEEFEEKGYPAYAETDIRHGYPEPAMEKFLEFVDQRKHSPFYEVWGTCDSEKLLSWLVLFKVDNWALFEASPSCDVALQNYANNALRYEVLRTLLVEEKRSEVLTGLSSINPNSDPKSLYIYNTRMGFEAVPMRRIFMPAAWLEIITKPKLAAHFWSLMTKILPQISALNKLAGMSRLISGLEDDPLGWVNELKDEN